MAQLMQQLLASDNYRLCLEALERSTRATDGSAPQAFHMLGAIHHGASGNPRIPVDLDASAHAYASCVTALLRAPSPAASPLFFDAVHACKAAVTEREVAAHGAAWLAVCAALKAAAAACDACAARGEADVAVVAHFGLAQAAYNLGERERAARRYRRALRAAAKDAPCTDARARECAAGAAENLAVLEAATPEARALANAVVMQAGPQRVDFVELPADTPAVARPACTGCGATPLALKKCAGTCGGAARYCGAACYAAHVRQHMRDAGCKKKPAGA
jgi:hypothetical protein